MVKIRLKCPYCASDHLIKYGITPNGKQRYRCQACNRQHREHPGSNAYVEATRELILRAYQERSSLRGLSRTFGVTRNTVGAWLKKSPDVAAFEHHTGPRPARSWLIPSVLAATATARRLWSRIPSAYLHTDHLESYHNVLPPKQHHATYHWSPTNHVERFNNTLRQRLGRFVRKTLSFSKSPLMHECVIRLSLHRYNLNRLHDINILK